MDPQHERELLRIVAGRLDKLPEEIGYDSVLFGRDPVPLCSLKVYIEDFFDIAFDHYNTDHVRTFGDLCKVVRKILYRSCEY